MFDHTISYSDLRENLKASLDEVCSTHSPLLVHRRNGEDVVIISREDFAAMEETVYLLRSPKNAQRLLEALHRSPNERHRFHTIEDIKNDLGD